MYKVNLVCVGDLKEKFFLEAQEEYVKRLKRFCEFKIIQIPEQKLSQNPSKTDIEKSLNKEFSLITPHLKGKVVVCAVEGKTISSEDFSTKLFKFFEDFDAVTFVIGSSYGLSNLIKSNNFLLSFSPMTLPHHLMRIVLEEQIYRAFTIKNNITYHK